MLVKNNQNPPETKRYPGEISISITSQSNGTIIKTTPTNTMREIVVLEIDRTRASPTGRITGGTTLVFTTQIS